MATMTLPAESQQQTATKPCRFCGAALQQTFVDLGMSPLCETYPSAADLNCGETYYPLHAYVCSKCVLVQLERIRECREYLQRLRRISLPTLIHGSDIARAYCDEMMRRFGLNEQELCSRGSEQRRLPPAIFCQTDVPVLGIEPAANVAKVAVEKGVPTLVRFFECKLAKKLAAEGPCADLFSVITSWRRFRTERFCGRPEDPA